MGIKSDYEKYEKLFPGAHAITMGDSTSAVINGMLQAHIYGSHFELLVNLEQILGQILSRSAGMVPGAAVGVASFVAKLFGGKGFLPYASSSGEGPPSDTGTTFGVAGDLLGGIGGKVAFTYGDAINLLYGNSTDIKRAVTTTVTGKNYLTEWLAASASPSTFSPTAVLNAAQPDPNDPTSAATVTRQAASDRTVGIACGLLSGVMCLVALVLELLIVLKYPVPNPTAALTKDMNALKTNFSPDAITPPPSSDVEGWLMIVATGVPPRIAALVKRIEVFEQNVRNAAKHAAIAEAEAKRLKEIEDAVNNMPSVPNAPLVEEVAAQVAQDAEQEGEEAVEQVSDVERGFAEYLRNFQALGGVVG